MSKVKLGDVCEILNGFAFKSENYVSDGIRVIRIANVQKGYVEDTDPQFYPLESESEINKYLLHENDLLISLTGNVGRVAILQKSMLPAALNQRVACLRMKEKSCISKEYLFQFLNYDKFEDECIASSKGVAQKNMSTEWLKDYRIPVCSEEKQKKITDQLYSVDALMNILRSQLEKLDTLVKSRFVEMFGDPYSNPMEWRTMTFKQAAVRLSDGPFGSNLKSEHYTDSGVRVVRLGNIGCGEFIDKDKSYISFEHYESLKKYTCKPGEIVIGTLGEPNLRACLIPSYINIAINKADCVHYIPNRKVLNNIFVCQYINCQETLLLASSLAHGQTRTRISSGQIAQLPIYIPPIDLQRQFADFVDQIDKSKLAVQKSLEKLETLKKSLMQEYFG